MSHSRTMLTQLSKSWRSTQYRPNHLSSPKFPQCRPCFASRIAYTCKRFYSDPTSGNLDEATLHNFKRVWALRQEFERERRDGVDILFHPPRHARKLARNRDSQGKLLPNILKARQLNAEYLEILSEMCKAEHRKREESKMNGLPPGLHPGLERFFRDMQNRRLFYHEAVPIVAHFKALIEADAVQQQPLLSGQERTALKDVLKEFLMFEKWVGRLQVAQVLAVASLGFWIWNSLRKWLERNQSERERDFKEIHTWDNDVE